jgi:GntR family transcriptional regulator
MTNTTDSGKTTTGVRRLRQLIATLGVGIRIPSERDLARDWGVARMTVRHAIDILIKEGQLERRAGSGTYVAQPPYAKTVGLSSFTDDMRSRGWEPSSRLLDFGEHPADPATAMRLGVDEDESVYEFTRLRLADDQPIAVETNWIPAVVVPGLERADLHGSLFTLLADRYGIQPGEANSTVDAVLPDPATAQVLEVGEHSPCLRIQMDYLDQRRRPLMAATGIYSGARYQLKITLSASAFASTGARE